MGSNTHSRSPSRCPLSVGEAALSLNVVAYAVGPAGLRRLESRLAGPEAYRERLYGSQAARALGLQLLPSLVERDVWAEGGEAIRQHHRGL